MQLSKHNVLFWLKINGSIHEEHVVKDKQKVQVSKHYLH